MAIHVGDNFWNKGRFWQMTEILTQIADVESALILVTVGNVVRLFGDLA